MKFFKRAVSLVLALVLSFGILAIIPQTKADASFVIDYEITSDAVYMVNLDTGIVVYEKNADKVKYPASLTKMMTCLIALEYYTDPASEYVTITRDVMTNETLIKNGVWSTCYLVEGERVTLQDLLFGALLPSDNYSALAIAYFVSSKKGDGTLLWFVDKMNDKARELGCQNTQFMNPHGLFHEKHYSTANDLFLIARAAMQNATFANIVNTTVYYRGATNRNTFENFDQNRARLENTNKMLSTAYEKDGYYYQYVKGIKTGFLEKARHCLATYATKDGYSYICICLDDGQPNSNDKNLAMIDTKTLYQWAFSSLDLKEVVSADKPVAEADIELAWNQDTIELYPSESFTTLMPSNVESTSVMVKMDLPEAIKAPVKKGEVVGKAELVYGDTIIGTINLVAGETVQRSELLYVLNSLTGLLGSTAFAVIIAVIVLAAVGYVVYSLITASSVNSLKKVHRYRKM